MRKDITVTHMKSATGIDSLDNLLTFDYKAGESMKPIECVCLFDLPWGFLEDLRAYKIALVPEAGVLRSDVIGYEFAFFTIQPQFGYTNQKLEDILCNLFEKYNL